MAQSTYCLCLFKTYSRIIWENIDINDKTEKNIWENNDINDKTAKTSFSCTEPHQ